MFGKSSNLAPKLYIPVNVDHAAGKCGDPAGGEQRFTRIQSTKSVLPFSFSAP